MSAPQMLSVHQRLLGPTSMTNSATQTANLDTVTSRGKVDKVSISLLFGAELNTNAVGPTISLQHSDDTVVTNFATVTANRTNEDLTNARLLRYSVDMQGLKRYLRLSVTTPTATNDNVTFAAIATLHHLDQEPGTTTQMVATTNDAVVIVS